MCWLAITPRHKHKDIIKSILEGTCGPDYCFKNLKSQTLHYGKHGGNYITQKTLLDGHHSPVTWNHCHFMSMCAHPHNQQGAAPGTGLVQSGIFLLLIVQFNSYLMAYNLCMSRMHSQDRNRMSAIQLHAKLQWISGRPGSCDIQLHLTRTVWYIPLVNQAKMTVHVPAWTRYNIQSGHMPGIEDADFASK